MKLCLHIHTQYSHDSTVSVERVVDAAIDLGYDVIAITDHDTVQGAQKAKSYVEKHKLNIKVIVGAEFTTEKGHILAYFIDDRVEHETLRQNKVYNFDDLVNKIREQGGLSFLAHPIQSYAKKDITFIHQLDGYECINGRVESSFNRDKSSILIGHLDQALSKARLGGCDAHTIEELSSVYITVEDNSFESKGEACDEEQTLKALLMGEKNLYYKSNKYRVIAKNKLKENKGKSKKFYFKQCVKYLLGIGIDYVYDLRNKDYEVIRVRKKS